MRKKEFSVKLLRWHKTIDRPLPWKEERDPYLIWLSEIILQQTRVEQGLPYYLKFKTRFPNVKSLAKAKEDKVLKLWQGLGYYTRARNLHHTAKYIHQQLNGKFPDKFEAIRKLKGVGDYTAAAISSFAFDLPYPVVDGNVYRVLSRIFGIKTPVDSPKGRRAFRQLAERLIDKKLPANYNQAIMDFGAIQCVPKNPNCGRCPFKKNCYALKNKLIAKLPVKEKKLVKKQRYFHYIVINDNGSIYLTKRKGKDIWKNLYEFPMIEGEDILSLKKLKLTRFWQNLFEDSELIVVKESGSFSQTLTHQKIQGLFLEVSVSKGLRVSNDLIKVAPHKFGDYAFPGVVRKYLESKL